MDDQELDLLYAQQLNEELQLQSRNAIARLIEELPLDFGLENLVPVKTNGVGTMVEKMAMLYQEVCEYYNANGIPFDHAWHWSFVWRQQLSYKALGSHYGVDQVVSATNPRGRKAVKQIYLENLDSYMQWFPWSWFSNMQFIGAGGFSAVYAALMIPPYDAQPTRVALKIVDDKILNEISVQSKAFLPLLFQGLTVCESTGDLMMVMKMSNDGNLEDHMQQLPLGDLDLKTITGTILRLAQNLTDLHKVQMNHRNVHPRNIMCTDSDYFLVDYRYATPSKESSAVTSLTKAVYGRLPYIAPEVRRGVYTEKSDMYSLGIIIWQLVSKVIFPSPDVLLDGANAAGGNVEDNPYRIEHVEGVPDWYKKLYVSCLEPRPENRPEAAELCVVLQAIHDKLDYSVPLNRRVTEYIVARRAEVADHQRTYAKVKGMVSASTSRLYTLSNLPSTEHFFSLPFRHIPFAMAMADASASIPSSSPSFTSPSPPAQSVSTPI
ncbi:kinase-like protein [Hesseltinella vesiculosa]|uniref:Kinase-like protein n=1 Tax=Hesseltinella vesiculosa TaxID=101127 RepID=A0A1X2G5P3_9FUNG|nr:kinase-like protein [Hesseltinella vesiculosa]